MDPKVDGSVHTCLDLFPRRENKGLLVRCGQRKERALSCTKFKHTRNRGFIATSLSRIPGTHRYCVRSDGRHRNATSHFDSRWPASVPESRLHLPMQTHAP